eukprot:CAMPEP_0119109408 /NCGR_PEP_ID=MMETSP1180-20130426/17889_1 /TAXON_ID=3052 ORGANISM="Chlamydomonas cf sp, Strain CCMP681" /NCGR_SAMPLE_ID=MMETSP1180 /ASSEMBLY_ACC=CAM_ASM_000741 /LENGTH=437 /DNA_ID=CAMNT_0007095163 /DNA_START=15 /DNA_END=1328 /DNA_ORIENTATION=+
MIMLPAKTILANGRAFLFNASRISQSSCSAGHVHGPNCGCPQQRNFSCLVQAGHEHGPNCGCQRRAFTTGASTAAPAVSHAPTGKVENWSGGWGVSAAGEPLKPWGVPLGELLPDQVDIQPTHNGVCHTDIHMQGNDWGITTFPFIPGHEVVGVVRAIGSQVKNLKVGQRVGAGWMLNSCRRCTSCLKGEENICHKGYEGTIIGNNGGFQAVMRMPSDFVFSIPDAIDSASAAPLLCAGVTVYAPLKRYMVRPGMKVGIFGIGGLGHLGVQFANAMGGVVTAFDIDPSKKDEAKSLGAAKFVAWSKNGAAENMGSQDLIINCASGNVKTEDLMKMVTNDGTVVQIGIPGGNPVLAVPLTDLVFGQKKVVGSIVGGRFDMMGMFEVAAAKNVRPMIEVVPGSQVNEAFARVQSGKARYRVVLDMLAENSPVLTTVAPK